MKDKLYTTKENRVQSEIDRLNAIFENVDQNKRDFCREMIRQLAWYEITCADLMRSIDETGTSLTFQNGANQSGRQANPDANLLVQFQKHINAITKQLIDIVPIGAQNYSKLAEFLSLDITDV